MPEGGVRTKTLGLVFSAAVFCGLEDVSPEPEMIYQHQIYSTDEEVNTRNLTIVFYQCWDLQSLYLVPLYGI